jgi:EAL domain-containing protein (putative c-di-GMP-specific phosphodiesterase class I)
VARDIFEDLRRQLGAEPEAEAPPLFAFVVDDEKGIRRLVSYALRELGAESEEYLSVLGMAAGLAQRHPDLIFLDISLDNADAIDAFRFLEQQEFRGAVQLMSGRDAVTMEKVKRAGEQRGLRMLPILQKPFRADAVRNVLHRLKHDAPALALGGAVASSGPTSEPDARTINLDEALRSNWLELWYQPKVDLRQKALAGAEGLIRARHPDHGVLSPASFLPGASETSLLALTEFAIASALRDWHMLAASGKPMRLAVNAPVSALTRISIASLVKEHAPKTPRWPGLILEVTEDQIVRDIPLVQEIATQFSLYSVKLAIDDFGTGYSSFARLRELPFCELKLDRSFVRTARLIRPTEASAKP